MKHDYGKLIDGTWDFYALLFTHAENQRQGAYYTFADGSGGNNHPGHDRLIEDGMRLLIPTVYDISTHQLIPSSYSIIDAETMQQDTVALSVGELAANLHDKRASLTCTLLQLKKALNLTGKRGAVTSELANADQDTKDAFDCASIVKRLDPMVISFGGKLGMTDKEMDDFIVMAGTL